MANKIITTDTLKTVLTDVANSITDINEQIHEPLSLELVNDNNNFSVGVDNNGTKYDAIESSESTIELNGRTLVNLWGNKPEHFNRNLNQTKFENGIMKVVANSTNVTCMNKRIELFKPSTEYTIILTIFKNTLNEKFYLTSVGGVEGAFGCATTYLAGTTGTFVLKLRTMDDISNCKYALRSYVNTSCSTGEIEFQCIILEGDYTNVPIEYFEGLQSSEPTEIKSVGKNLFDREKFIKTASENIKAYDEAQFQRANPRLIGDDSFALSSSAYQQLYATYDVSNLIGNYMISCYFEIIDYSNEEVYASLFKNVNGVRKEITAFNINKIINNNNNIAISVDLTDVTDISIGGWGYNGTLMITNFMIEKGTQATQYEPYKENIVTLPNIESLRSLPNGICDEAFIHDDKLVITRRIGKVVYNENNANEWWRNSVTDSKEGVFVVSRSVPSDIDKTLGITEGYAKYILSDKFINKVDTNTPNNIYTTGSSIVLTISNTHTPNSTIEEFKAWITNNPFVMIYQLATPTYEWYELPSPHLYEDGNAFIDSGSVPLTSTTHNIDLSVRSIIETNVEEIVQLKEELNALELELSSEEDVSELINIFKEGE